MRMFKTKMRRCGALGFLFAVNGLAFADGIQREPLTIGSAFDIGQINADIYDNGENELQMVQRTAVTMKERVDIQDRLSLSVGIRGMFWYHYPETNQSHTRLTKFISDVLEAQGVYRLGAPSDPWGKVQFGLFPFKYNPDAKNLGEYLLRSGAYPNYITTGGWSIINSAEFLTEGVNLEARTGPLKHNLLVTIERGIEPINDLSPIYMAAYAPNKVFDIGLGVEFAHLIAVKPSATTPNGPTFKGDPLNRYKGDSLVFDTATTGYSNFTFKSTKLMARASLNLQALIQSTLLGPEDLKFYAEAAVLGVKDYPYYYEGVIHRIPIMAGVNLPTFKLMDMLSFEVEYQNTQFAENVAISYENGLPIPQVRKDAIGTYQDAVAKYDKDANGSQDLKWSFYGKKSVIPGLTLYAQAASDHMRGIQYTKVFQSDLVTKSWNYDKHAVWYFPFKGDWYFLFRVELGI
jgi:hypothetical protein